MISSKKLPGLTAWLLVLALAAAFLFPSALGAADGTNMAYEQTVFGQELLHVDIVVDENDWNDLLEHAIDEEYISAAVVINNEKYANVGIRAKGNTSLSQVAASDSDRFSFKIKFDEYETGGNCDGLRMLVLNNLMGDASYLKEYLTYDMFAYLNADASLYTMARVTVNGEPWGIYLALEPVDETMLLRTSGSAGALYKPDSMDMGDKGGGGQPRMPDDADFEAMREEMEEKRAQMQEQGGFDPSMMQKDFGGGKGGFGEASGGADLNYIDDDPDSYSSIWEGAKTDTTDADHARVVEALRHICAGEDLEQYLDVDNMLRYMAVQTFVVNLDSLTGSMAHNYYLSENGGRLNLLPWDYNLAFGGYMTDDASDMINFPIDTPFTASMEERQFFAALLENEEYLAQYHTYLRDLCEGYVETELPQTYAAMRVLLDGLVGTEDADPTAFYTNEEYQAAVEMLRQTIELRAQSVLGQIEGTIPSTSEGQEAEPHKLLDCSSIDLSVMGNMFGNNRGGFGGPGDFDGTEPFGKAPDGAEPADDPSQQAASAAGEFPGQEPPEEGAAAEQTALSAAARPARGAEGDGGKPTGGALPAGTALNAGAAAGENPSAANTDMAADGTPARPAGGPWDSEAEENPDGTEIWPRFAANLAVTLGALGVLVLAVVFARLYHRRKFRIK